MYHPFVSITCLKISRSTAESLCRFDISDCKSDTPFTLIVKARASVLSGKSALLCVGQMGYLSPQFYCIVDSSGTLDIECWDTDKKAYFSLVSNPKTTIALSVDFEVAFVQDTSSSKWITYVNGAKEAECNIPTNFSWREPHDSVGYHFSRPFPNTDSTTQNQATLSQRPNFGDTTYTYWNGVVSL